MKIIEIVGGLGNQMFIYAFGKALEKTSKDTVLFDISWYSPDMRRITINNITPICPDPRQFELLDIFPNIRLTIASVQDKIRVCGMCTNPTIQALRNRITPAPTKRILTEHPANVYNPELLQVRGDAWYRGYFQDARYFASLRREMLHDFTFAPLALTDAHNLELTARIRAASSPVAIHIRRGDYLKLPAVHPACPLTYYRAAARLIKEKIPAATFFVFGEDIEWITSAFEIGYPTQHLQGQGIGMDMHLMTLCRHHIIANSSYSWWGAWLAAGADKIVVAPDSFIGNPVCADWIMLPAHEHTPLQQDQSYEA